MAGTARIALALALAATTPGCVSILTAVAGGGPSAMRAAGQLDGAVLGAIGEAIGTAVAHGDAEEPARPAYAEGDLYDCRIATGEVQEINAFSLEGARAACIMSNDVDLVPEGCDCRPRAM